MSVAGPGRSHGDAGAVYLYLVTACQEEHGAAVLFAKDLEKRR
jgi:hypothetical protein